MKFKFIDIFLISLIVGSVGFVGYRVLAPKLRTTVPEVAIAPMPPRAVTPVQVATPKAHTLPVENLPFLFSAGFNTFLNSIPVISDNAWLQLLADPQVMPFVVDKTDRCAMETLPNSNVFYFVLPALLEGFKANTRQLLIDVGRRRCMKNGDRVMLGSYSNLPTDPLISIAGGVEVRGLISIPGDRIPASLLVALGISRDDLDIFIKSPRTNSYYPITFVRLVKFQPMEPPADRPVPAFLRYPVIGSADIQFMKRNGKVILFIDVRSAAEANKNSLPNTLNLPFKISESRFRWDMRVSELNKVPFDLSAITAWRSRLQDPTKAAIVVIGNGPTDGRPIWALMNFLKFEFEDVFWFYDGASALEATLR
jgi:hypothetical protein